MAFVVPIIRKVKKYEKRRCTNTTEDVQYRLLYRFTKNNVTYLANEFMGQSVETRGGALDSVQRMEITLRYLADPGFQTGVGFEVGVHQSTVSRAIAATVTKITEQAPNWIKFPTSLEKVFFSKEE